MLALWKLNVVVIIIIKIPITTITALKTITTTQERLAEVSCWRAVQEKAARWQERPNGGGVAAKRLTGLAGQWGCRGGSGPLRDEHGNMITDLNKVGRELTPHWHTVSMSFKMEMVRNTQRLAAGSVDCCSHTGRARNQS